MNLSGQDSQGNKLNAELEELQDLKTEIKILDALKPIEELLNEVKNEVMSIKSKVVIHNNYESRIRTLERNQYIFAAVFFVVGLISGTAGALILKIVSKIQ